MTSKILLISLSLLLAWQAARAQTAPAVDFFNSGAQFYISNNIPAALEKVENGRKLYPDDVKLKELEALLKQQQQSQSQQNQSQQRQNQQNQQQQSRQNQKSSQAQNQQSPQNQPQQDQQREQQQAQSAQEKSGKEKREQQANTQAMTPAEAKQLLDSQKGNEQFLQLKPHGNPQDNRQPIKDW
jgi:Ca-activated chloride channel homolog